MRPTRPLGLGVLAPVALLALAACGGHGSDASPARHASPTPHASATTHAPVVEKDFAHLPPARIVAAAEHALRVRHALHYSGEIDEVGGRLSVDITSRVHGDCSGRIATGNGTSEFTRIGTDYWFRPDAGFWHATLSESDADQVISLLDDRYLVLPVGDHREVDRLCDVKELESLDGGLSNSYETFQVAGPGQTSLGRPTVEIISHGNGSNVTVADVLVGRGHDVARIERTVADSKRNLTFDHFDAPYHPKPPDRVLDIGQNGKQDDCSPFVGCHSTVSPDNLEDAITTEVGDTGSTISDVDCPDELVGTVGATTRCTAVVGGHATGITLTTTSAHQGTVKFDIVLDATPS